MQNSFGVEVETSNLETDIAVLEEAMSENSDVSAQNVLGYCHYYGIGVEIDKEKAKALFRKGCDAGDDMAMCAMGVIYDKAGRFDTAVIELGNSEAMVWLSRCYHCADGVEEDENNAFSLISSATKAGNEEAETILTSYIMHGIGTGENEEKASAMLHRLCASGNALATKSLAL